MNVLQCSHCTSLSLRVFETESLPIFWKCRIVFSRSLAVLRCGRRRRYTSQRSRPTRPITTTIFKALVVFRSVQPSDSRDAYRQEAHILNHRDGAGETDQSRGGVPVSLGHGGQCCPGEDFDHGWLLSEFA